MPTGTTKEEYRKACLCAAYLAGCAAGGRKPGPEMTTEAVALTGSGLLFRAAERHMITSAVAAGLASAGIKDAAFAEAEAKAIRKNVLLDSARAEIFARFEAEGIAHMPLKGSVLQLDYPSYGMRQMSDNDILIDAGRAADVRRIMESLGYSTEQFDASAHDIYHKDPVYNFEMHRELVSETAGPVITGYYAGVWSRLHLREGNGTACEYRFTDEDFYVYITAHAYKHFSHSGTGLRSLLDTYVFLKKHPGLDEGYIAAELEKLDIADFERTARRLALDLFGEDGPFATAVAGSAGTDGTSGAVSGLPPEENDMLEYVIDSGTYGTLAHGVGNEVAKRGKLGFFIRKAFLPYRSMCSLYPALKKAPVLLPFCWVARWVRALVKKPEKVGLIFRSAISAGKKED